MGAGGDMGEATEREGERERKSTLSPDKTPPTLFDILNDRFIGMRCTIGMPIGSVCSPLTPSSSPTYWVLLPHTKQAPLLNSRPLGSPPQPYSEVHLPNRPGTSQVSQRIKTITAQVNTGRAARVGGWFWALKTVSKMEHMSGET